MIFILFFDLDLEGWRGTLPMKELCSFVAKKI
jgi:hypothetical protein